MFLIECQDEFFIKNLISISNQKNLNFVSELNKKHFATIVLKLNNNGIIIIYENRIIKINKPIKIDDIFLKITDLLSDFNYKFNQASYFPIKQLFEFEGKNARLGKIHHEIISNLLLNNEFGCNKFDLYQIIWPEDKEISINKLETHITNLKNLLKSKTAFNINIRSVSGKLRIN